MSRPLRAGWQILVRRLRPHVGHQVIAAPRGHQLRHLAVGVRKIAEVAGIGRAGADAGRLTVFFGQSLVVDPIDAERAFLHHTLGRIHLARAVRAGPGAKAAADAGIFVDQHDPVLGPLVAGPRRADGDARRVVAVEARTREGHHLRRGVRHSDLIGMDPVQEGPRGIGAIGVLVRQADAGVVPALAGGDAGLTADAGVKVDHQTKLLGGRVRAAKVFEDFLQNSSKNFGHRF